MVNEWILARRPTATNFIECVAESRLAGMAIASTIGGYSWSLLAEVRNDER